MPREVVTIQVGQCGNQVGCRFWDLVLREHAHVSKAAVFDASLSSFFRHVDSRFADPVDIPVGDGRTQLRTLKARSILVDMEESVVNSLLTGPLADLFDARQTITDVSGSGNNWAHGHHVYGPAYRDQLENKVRQAAEKCDSLQCFLLLHSLGGGTGSGLGTFICETLEDSYPEVFRFVSCVCPSKDDDVITSPYNTTLALRSLIHSASCVLPVSNDALVGICNQISSHDAGRASALTDLPQDDRPRRPPAAPRRPPSGSESGRGEAPGEPAAAAGGGRGPRRRSAGSAPPPRGRTSAATLAAVAAPTANAVAAGAAAASGCGASDGGQVCVGLGVERPFDRMNSLVAHLLNNLTSSMRFEGSLNLDLNEITMNLVPFPRMHFLLSSMSPLYFAKDPKLVARGFHQTFSDVLAPGNQLMNVDPRGSTYMAVAFLVRGSASIADVTRNVARVRKQLKMLPYNEDAFKIGLCAVPPRGLPYSVLGLANSCAAHHMLGQNLQDFSRLYKRKAHVHHYTQYMERELFDDAFETVNSLMKDYINLDMLHRSPPSTAGRGGGGGGGGGSSAASLLFAPSARASQAALEARAADPAAALQHYLPRPVI